MWSKQMDLCHSSTEVYNVIILIQQCKVSSYFTEVYCDSDKEYLHLGQTFVPSVGPTSSRCVLSYASAHVRQCKKIYICINVEVSVWCVCKCVRASWYKFAFFSGCYKTFFLSFCKMSTVFFFAKHRKPGFGWGAMLDQWSLIIIAILNKQKLFWHSFQNRYLINPSLCTLLAHCHHTHHLNM